MSSQRVRGSTCVALAPGLPPGLGSVAALAPVSMLGVGAAGGDLLVPGARPREALFTLGFLLELSHIAGQLGAEHAVKAAFSAALRFYLLQQRERESDEDERGRERPFHSRSQQPQEHQNVRGRELSFARTQEIKGKLKAPCKIY